MKRIRCLVARTRKSASRHPILPALEPLQARMMLSGEAPSGRAPEWQSLPFGMGVALYGTDADDVITIEPGANPGDLVVSGISGLPDGTVLQGIARLSVYAGAGNDIVVYRAMLSQTFVSGLGWGTGGPFYEDGDPASRRGCLYGEDGNDTLIAYTNAELSGGRGDDTLMGSAQDDEFYPGPGNDFVDGGDGLDALMIEGAGSDPLSPSSRVVVRLDLGTVPLDGYGGHDTLLHIEDVSVTSATDDEIYGSDGDNRIFTALGHDSVYGGAGNDTLIGICGPNYLFGGPHYLYGGDGDDVFFTDNGANIVQGDAGHDIARQYWNGPYFYHGLPQEIDDVPLPEDQILVATSPVSASAAPPPLHATISIKHRAALGNTQGKAKAKPASSAKHSTKKSGHLVRKAKHGSLKLQKRSGD